MSDRLIIILDDSDTINKIFKRGVIYGNIIDSLRLCNEFLLQITA